MPRRWRSVVFSLSPTALPWATLLARLRRLEHRDKKLDAGDLAERESRVSLCAVVHSTQNISFGALSETFIKQRTTRRAIEPSLRDCLPYALVVLPGPYSETSVIESRLVLAASVLELEGS